MFEIKNLSKTYGITKVLENISFKVEKGSFTAIFGPSGCGKTTLLKIIARIIKPTTGNIRYKGKIGMVFQYYSLFPWLNVRKNIGFACKQKKTVNELLRIIGLEDFAEYYPHELSGGMQQRVAIARTLATEPDIILLDEPFGSLDKKTRKKMQKFVKQLHKKSKKTFILVTHNETEAKYLADKIIKL